MNNHINHFRQAFLHPRVYIFIVIGIVVIFLTFLTNNNALEIAISGIASVFIGIGVNNFSSLETRLKDEQKIKSILGHTVKMMNIVQTRMKIIHGELDKDNYAKMKVELAELEQIINFSIGLIKDDETLG
jgi:hypothetical protein